MIFQKLNFSVQNVFSYVDQVIYVAIKRQKTLYSTFTDKSKYTFKYIGWACEMVGFKKCNYCIDTVIKEDNGRGGTQNQVSLPQYW